MPAVGTGEAATDGAVGTAADMGVLVVDDQRTFAEAVGLAVDSQRGLRCVGTVGSAEEALEHAGSSRPDVVLLDVCLPGMGGLEAVPLLKDLCPQARILVLTVDTSRSTMVGAALAGADGFLPKDAPFTEILGAVRSSEALPVGDGILEHIVAVGGRPAAAPGAGPAEVLTEREHEVLQLLALGLAVKQIARELDISVHTCRGHVRSILQKLGVHSQLAAVVAAARRGMLDDLGT